MYIKEFFLSDPKWPPSGVLYDSSLCVSTKHVHKAFPGIMRQNLIKILALVPITGQ